MLYLYSHSSVEGLWAAACYRCRKHVSENAEEEEEDVLIKKQERGEGGEGGAQEEGEEGEEEGEGDKVEPSRFARVVAPFTRCCGVVAAVLGMIAGQFTWERCCYATRVFVHVTKRLLELGLLAAVLVASISITYHQFTLIFAHLSMPGQHLARDPKGSLGHMMCSGLDPKPQTLNPKPQTLNLKPQTSNPKP
jgi:hypothetical protein